MKIVFLVRLAVVFPFTWVNYAFGLTAIPLWRYVLATFLGIIPATAAFVFASSAATKAATGGTSNDHEDRLHRRRRRRHHRQRPHRQDRHARDQARRC